MRKEVEMKRDNVLSFELRSAMQISKQQNGS